MCEIGVVRKTKTVAETAAESNISAASFFVAQNQSFRITFQHKSYDSETFKIHTHV